MSLLEKAIELAVHAHAGQQDEDDFPHIVHALAVMFGVKKELENGVLYDNRNYTGTLEDLMIAAVLHDTVEDSGGKVTLDIIETLFSKSVRDMVDGVTRRGLGEDETKEFYRDFIYRAKGHPGSRIIKIADLLHNYGRSHKIKKASWRDKLVFKYSTALSVLSDSNQPTWEQASYSVTFDGDDLGYGKSHYSIADPDGKKVEITREEAIALMGERNGT